MVMMFSFTLMVVPVINGYRIHILMMLPAICQQLLICRPGHTTMMLKYRVPVDPVSPYPPPPTYPQPFSITHTYTNTTNLLIDRTVTLLVKNSSGCADIFTKTITIFPEIYSAFSVDNDDGCDPLPVQFQNNSWGNTDTWLWEFGDGGPSIEENPLHVFRNH